MHHLAPRRLRVRRRTQEAMTRHAVFDHTRYEIFGEWTMYALLWMFLLMLCGSMALARAAVRYPNPRPWRGRSRPRVHDEQG